MRTNWQEAPNRTRTTGCKHDDVIKWKHFPCYWPFGRIIHHWPVNSSHKCQWCGALIYSLICALNKRLSKQSWGWLFEMPSLSLWRHCNGPETPCKTSWFRMCILYKNVHGKRSIGGRSIQKKHIFAESETNSLCVLINLRAKLVINGDNQYHCRIQPKTFDHYMTFKSVHFKESKGNDNQINQ